MERNLVFVLLGLGVDRRLQDWVFWRNSEFCSACRVRFVFWIRCRKVSQSVAECRMD